MICWETLGPGIHVDATLDMHHPSKRYCGPSSPLHDDGTPQWQWPPSRTMHPATTQKLFHERLKGCDKELKETSDSLV